MRKMTAQNNRKILSYLMAQRVILFLAFYEYLTRINRNPKFKTENSKCFLYDALNRLTQAQSSAYGTITYNYDEIGNMTYNSQVGNYTYWKQYYGTKPH